MNTIHTKKPGKKSKKTNRKLQSLQVKKCPGKLETLSFTETERYICNKRKKGTNIMQRKKFIIQLPSHEKERRPTHKKM